MMVIRMITKSVLEKSLKQYIEDVIIEKLSKLKKFEKIELINFFPYEKIKNAFEYTYLVFFNEPILIDDIRNHFNLSWYYSAGWIYDDSDIDQTPIYRESATWDAHFRNEIFIDDRILWLELYTPLLTSPLIKKFV